MKSASIPDLTLQGHSGRPSPARSNAGLDSLGIHWREMVQDTVAAIAIASVIVFLAYLYWGA